MTVFATYRVSGEPTEGLSALPLVTSTAWPPVALPQSVALPQAAMIQTAMPLAAMHSTFMQPAAMLFTVYTIYYDS